MMRFLLFVLILFAFSNQEECKLHKIDAHKYAETLVITSHHDENTFQSWMRQNGVFIHPHIAIHNFSDYGRGVIATSSLRKGEKILSIPINSNVIMNPQTTSQSKLENGDALDTILDKLNIYDDTNPTNLMALHLLYEYIFVGNKSFWFPYLEMLPTNNFTTLLYYNEEELEELQSDYVKQLVEMRMRGVKENFHKIFSKLSSEFKLPNLDKLTMKEWKWALTILWSRTFAVYDQRIEQKTPSLVPFGDLFNFNEKLTNVISRTEDGNIFTFFTTRDILIGEQLFVPYSTRLPNYKLMMEYGFCYDNNPNDEVLVNIDIYSNIQEDLKLILTMKSTPQNLDKTVLYWMRMADATFEEVEKMRRERRPYEKLSERNEKIVFAKLKFVLERKLKAYRTTIEEDEALLLNLEKEKSKYDWTSFIKKKCAIILRKQEKKILRNFLNKISSQ